MIRTWSRAWSSLVKAPSQQPAVCCCVVVAAAYTNRGGRPSLPDWGFKCAPWVFIFHLVCSVHPDVSGFINQNMLLAHSFISLGCDGVLVHTSNCLWRDRAPFIHWLVQVACITELVSESWCFSWVCCTVFCPLQFEFKELALDWIGESVIFDWPWAK